MLLRGPHNNEQIFKQEVSSMPFWLCCLWLQ